MSDSGAGCRWPRWSTTRVAKPGTWPGCRKWTGSASVLSAFRWAKAAVYVGAFAPEIAATVALDPHIAVNGSTNWYAPWYLDWTRRWPELPGGGTVLSLLNPDPGRPGFEHDHHELMALAAPRPFLLIGGASGREADGGDSDDRQSGGYVERAREVYRLLGVPDRLEFALTADGHKPNGPAIDAAWQGFFMKHLGGLH